MQNYCHKITLKFSCTDRIVVAAHVARWQTGKSEKSVQADKKLLPFELHAFQRLAAKEFSCLPITDCYQGSLNKKNAPE